MKKSRPKRPNRRRVRLACVVVTILILAGLVVWRSELLGVSGKLPETPLIIDVIVKEGNSRRKLEIRDPTAISVLQSLINGGKAYVGNPPGQSEFQLFVHPTNLKSYPLSPTPLWQDGEGKFVWQHDGRNVELNGNFRDFVAWLKIRRLNQLLRETDPERRELARQLREALRDEHVESLLRIANSTNGWFAQAGIREIGELVTVEPPRPYYAAPGEMQFPQRRAVIDPQRRVRDELLRLVSQGPRPNTEDPLGTVETALGTLQMIGDRATADGLAEILEGHRDGGRLGEKSLAALDQLYGIPATYERFGICGNSTAAELARFARDAAARQTAAIDDLLTWQKQHVNDSEQAFYDAVVRRWSEMLISHAQTPDRYGFHSDRTPAPKLTNLLGLGEPVVPALKRRQESVTDWQEIGMLEFCIAFLSGDCDAEFVTLLLDGDVAQQRVACYIIAASGASKWDDRLAVLLRTPIPNKNVDEVVVLRNVAAQALFRSRGVEALPEFRRALKAGFDSELLLLILNRLEVPQSEL